MKFEQLDEFHLSKCNVKKSTKTLTILVDSINLISIQIDCTRSNFVLILDFFEFYFQYSIGLFIYLNKRGEKI